MKIAYSNLACPDWTMKETFENAAKYGYKGVELRLWEGNVFPPDLSSKSRKEMIKLADSNDVEIIGIGASTSFAMESEEQRKKNELELIAYLKIAADMGIPMVRTFGGQSGLDLIHSSRNREDLVQRVAQSLNKIAPYAERLEVQVLLETHDDFSSSTMVRDVLERVSSPAIGALWDIHHPIRMGESTDETIHNLQNRLKHVHLKDARNTEDGWQLVPFGKGDLPLSTLLNQLKMLGYDGWFTVEWEKKWHPELKDPALALPEHIDWLRDQIDSTL